MREAQHFGVLCDTVMPELLAGRSGKIRILSAGCSTGEEAYSILISLIEKFGMSIKNRVEIYGVDIDRNVIKTAQEAVYGNNSFRNDEQVLAKYFTKRADNRRDLVPVIRGPSTSGYATCCACRTRKTCRRWTSSSTGTSPSISTGMCRRPYSRTFPAYSSGRLYLPQLDRDLLPQRRHTLAEGIQQCVPVSEEDRDGIRRPAEILQAACRAALSVTAVRSRDAEGAQPCLRPLPRSSSRNAGMCASCSTRRWPMRCRRNTALPSRRWTGCCRSPRIS